MKNKSVINATHNSGNSARTTLPQLAANLR